MSGLYQRRSESLGGLTDVDITNIQNGQAPVYNATQEVYTNQTILTSITTDAVATTGSTNLLSSGTIFDTISRDITLSATATQIKRVSGTYILSVENNSVYMGAGSYYLQAFTNGIKILSPLYAGYRDVLVTGGFAPSDDRLKFNERSIPNALQVINKLNPQVYEFAVSGLDYNERQTEAGFIAQDVEKIAEISYASRPPRGSGENYYHLHYQTLLTYAIKAIQELDARIKVLEAK